jgi:integrase
MRVWRNRWGQRDATMILLAYRHGLRAAELVDLRWDQVDFRTGTLHVRRVKAGAPATHPIMGDELRAFANCNVSKSRSHLRVCVRTWCPVCHGRLRPHDRAHGQGRQAGLQGTPSYAAPCLRLRARQQGARHAGTTGVPWAQEHSTHRAVH